MFVISRLYLIGVVMDVGPPAKNKWDSMDATDNFWECHSIETGKINEQSFSNSQVLFKKFDWNFH